MTNPFDELDLVFDEFFPGSKQKRDEIPDVEDLARVWDQSPVVYPVNGIDTEFFTIGALALALNRQVQTVRLWERQGKMPKATYRTAGKKQNRLYTRAQIEGIVAIATEEGLMDPTVKKPLAKTRFSERVLRLFKRLAEAAS